MRSTWLDTFRTVLVVVGYGTVALGALGITVIVCIPAAAPLAYLVLVAALVVLVLVAIARAERLRYFLGSRLRPAADVLVLGVLPPWGLLYNSGARAGETPSGKAFLLYSALAEPEVLGLVGLHAVTVLAYATCRRRPGALPGPAEPLVHAFLIAGIVLHTLVAVQLRGLGRARWIPAEAGNAQR